MSVQQTMSDDRWIVKGRYPKKAAFRVFGFHFAGGSALQFRNWDALVPDDIEILGVQLPGRESRYREPPLRELGALIELLAPARSEEHTSELQSLAYLV